MVNILVITELGPFPMLTETSNFYDLFNWSYNKIGLKENSITVVEIKSVDI